MNRWLGVAAAFAVLPLMMAAGGASAPGHLVPPAGPQPASGALLLPGPAGHALPQVHASGALTAITAPTAGISYAPGGPYIAAAYSISKAGAATATGDSSSDAEYNAIVHCDSMESPCQGSTWVLNGWLALAEYYTGSSSAPVVHAWAVEAGQTAAAAKANAVSWCNSLDNVSGTVCTYIGDASSPATTLSYTYGYPLYPLTATQPGNDYPTYLQNTPTPTPTTCTGDDWGMCARNCTSFVAWRINDNNGVYFYNSMPGPKGTGSSNNEWGSASDWGGKTGHAEDIGYTYNQTPTPRSIAWWGSNYKNEVSSAGHVAYVDQLVFNTSGVLIGIWIEQYNWNEEGEYSHVYIPVGGSADPSGFKYPEPYPEGFIHGLEGTQLITGGS